MATITRADIVSTFDCRTYDARGRSQQPRCDVCNRTIAVDNGEQWAMIAAGVLHELAGVACIECSRA